MLVPAVVYSVPRGKPICKPPLPRVTCLLACSNPDEARQLFPSAEAGPPDKGVSQSAARAFLRYTWSAVPKVSHRIRGGSCRSSRPPSTQTPSLLLCVVISRAGPVWLRVEQCITLSCCVFLYNFSSVLLSVVCIPD